MTLETVRCNNCDALFENDESLEWVRDKDDNEMVKGCPTCETDAYLMNLESA